MAEPTPPEHEVTKSDVLVWYGQNLRQAPLMTAALTLLALGAALAALWTLKELGLLGLLGLSAT
ncbi:MAG: hypothetical protein U1E45_14930 [Geminicoccaceae bacterium]